MPESASAALPDVAPPASPWWRRALPFALALALITFVVARLDLRAFAAQLAAVDAPLYLLSAAAFVLALLSADAWATTLVYRRSLAPVRYRDLWILRGASYLPSLLNHHVGQAFITYHLSRVHGVSLARAAGATLLVYASWSGAILGIGCLALWVTNMPVLWLALILGAGVLYLAVIAWKPAPLARVRLFAPLFEAGVSGHLFALFTRLPHVFVLFAGTWLPFHFFGVDIPLGAALSYIPILMVVATLPITPQGIGARDALAAVFFARYAAGATPGERLAAVAAATTSWAVAIALVEVLLGFALLRGMASRPGATIDEERAGVPHPSASRGQLRGGLNR